MIQRLANIACEYTFEASHQLSRADWSPAQNERVFGKCARVHGHSYRLVITLHGPVDAATGMVMNFTDLDRIVRERVLLRLDHHDLNAVVGGITTAENLVYWIVDQLVPHVPVEWLARVELWETRTNCAFLTQRDVQAYLLEQGRLAPSYA
jgi:6-pyruvoyltetrahydropterin/6-carboxytetrahydropterin synthase